MTKKNIFTRAIGFFNRMFLYLVHRAYAIIPLDEHLVVFESSLDFSDNSRVMFDYLKKNKPEYKLVWMLHGEKLPDNAPNIEVIHQFRTWHDVHVLSRAKYVFSTHVLGDLFHPRKDQMVVNLWHGIPFKGIKGRTPKKRTQFNLMMCLGEMNIDTTAKFVGCDRSLMRPWGYPRIDLLYSCRDVGRNNPFAPNDFTGRLIIWMPTFRKSVASHLSEDSCDSETGLPLLVHNKNLEDFNGFLQSINVVFIVKIHHLQSSKEAFKHNYSNIIFVQDPDISNRNLQLYEIIAKSDALLTDYSSVFADYMHMDRPIGFILDDLENYEKSRGGFLFNPITDVLCGFHIYNYEQLKEFCIEIAENKDTTKPLRDALINAMISYKDGNNCERIVSNILM